MALLVCKSCKKAFFSSPKEEEVCADCADRLRELYSSVHSFLRNNSGRAYTSRDISRIMGITQADVNNLISMGLLEYQKAPEAAGYGKDSVLTHSRSRKNQKTSGGKK